MLNKHNLSIAEFLDGKESRYGIHALHVTPEGTIATDGESLVRVTAPNLKAENFPVFGDFKAADKFKPFSLPRSSAIAIEKALPKRATIPVLNCAAIDPRTDKGDEAVIGVTDLDNPQVFRPRKEKGNYPDYTTVIPPLEGEKGPKFTITFDARKLAKLFKSAAKFTDDYNARVTVHLYAPDKAARFEARNEGTGQEWTGICMPVRPS